MTRAQRNALAELILAALRDPAARGALDALARVLAARTGVAIPREAAERLASMGFVAVADAPGGETVRAGVAQAFEDVRAQARRRIDRARAAAAAYWHGIDAAPGAVSTDPPDLAPVLRRAAALFDAWLYFEVHEELEAAWGRARGDTRVVLQGLIQVAVALHHAAHANPTGAHRLLAAARGKLEPHAPQWNGIALDDLLAALHRFETSEFDEHDAPPPRLTFRRV